MKISNKLQARDFLPLYSIEETVNPNLCPKHLSRLNETDSLTVKLCHLRAV